MNDRLRDLPTLDFLKGFEAAARHLSFTKAAQELFLTQSAVSRQVQTLEAQLGVALFERHTRAIRLTEAGRILLRAATDVLGRVREATGAIAAAAAGPSVTVSTTLTFASLWLIPRLASFQALHPGIEIRIAANNAIQDLRRDRIDVAIRYSTGEGAGPGAIRLFGERVVPVCSPKRLASGPEIRTPADLASRVLLHLDDPENRSPWLLWRVWFETLRLPEVMPAGALHFNQYDQLLRAALEGQGVALGRLPLVADLVRRGELVTPLRGRAYSTSAALRAYWVMVSDEAAGRADVAALVAWLRSEAGAEPEDAPAAAGAPRRAATARSARGPRSRKAP